MSKPVRSASSAALAAVLGAFLAYSAATAEQTAAPAAFDPARPETWDAAVAQIKAQEDDLVRSLIAVAKDHKRDTATRRQAVLTLSNMRNRRSLEFMIANVALPLMGGIAISPGDLAKETPCLYVLSHDRDWDMGTSDRGPLSGKRTDWNSAQAILFALRNDPRTPNDLMLFAHALEIILGPDLAVAAVDDTLKQRARNENTVWRKNLTGIKTYLEHK